MIKIYKVAHVHVGNNVLRPTIDSHDPPPRALKLKHRINDIDRRRERERGRELERQEIVGKRNSTRRIRQGEEEELSKERKDENRRERN